MVREDLVNSAVSFLQDPSVANAPLEKRISFLQSKNLTQDEINVSLARAGSTETSAAAAGVPTTQAYRGAPPPPPAGYAPYPGYGPYPGYWQQPPPEVPRRDWRDWFIMATVMGGVGFGLYVTAKRYVLPLIKPPTPPQLTQDKESIDESFTRAFSLLDQLESDTKVLKEAEETRTTRLDAALLELENVVASLKEADRKREDDARRNTDEIRHIRDLIPKALENEKNTTEARLKDLTTELKSLKTLVSNRVGAGAPSLHRPTGSYGASNGVSSPSLPAASTTPVSGATNPPAPTPQVVEPAKSTEPAAPASTDSSTSSTFSRFGSRGNSIPAWQMAAKKSQEQLKDTSASGTATEEASSS